MGKSLINYDVLRMRLKRFALFAGRMAARPALLLYYVLTSRETPFKDKMVIFTTLAYVVLPIDLLSTKRLPIIGWADEIASLSVTYEKLCKYITPEIERKADAVLDRWFASDYSNRNVEVGRILETTYEGPSNEA